MRSPQNFNSVGVHRSRFEYGALGLVSIISPSSELGIAHRFFCWITYSSRNIVSKYEYFYQPLKLMVNRFNWFKFFFRRSTGSSGLLANGSAFGIFGALVQDGSSLSAPNGLGGWFYVRFGPFFGLIATQLESMWILGRQGIMKL